MRVTPDKAVKPFGGGGLIRSRRKWESPKPGHTWADCGIDKTSMPGNTFQQAVQASTKLKPCRC